VSKVLHPARHIIGHFGDESFQAITRTGADNCKVHVTKIHFKKSQDPWLFDSTTIDGQTRRMNDTAVPTTVVVTGEGRDLYRRPRPCLAVSISFLCRRALSTCTSLVPATSRQPSGRMTPTSIQTKLYTRRDFTLPNVDDGTKYKDIVFCRVEHGSISLNPTQPTHYQLHTDPTQPNPTHKHTVKIDDEGRITGKVA